MCDGHEESRWAEYKEYISSNYLTDYERGLLRKWVKDGHSVNERVQSRYLPDSCDPSMDFIDAYRHDRAMRKAMSGMTSKEKEAFMKDCIGLRDDRTIPESTEDKLLRATQHIHKLEHDLFFLREFLMDEWMTEAADEYLDKHAEDPIPFEWS